MGFTRHKAPPLLSRYAEDKNGCWIYQGEVGRAGYGVVTIGQRRDGNRRRYAAHRYFYEHLVGPIPDGMLLCHKCDVPACVNPKHMFVGTQVDNMRDMHSKGRGRTGAKGERNHFSRLTGEKARQIREASGSARIIAEQFGIRPVTVNAIKAGRIWRHI